MAVYFLLLGEVMNRDIQYDVIIIDSGCANSVDEPGMHFYMDKYGNIKNDDLFEDDVGHGTAVYGIIKGHNSDVKCLHIKIFDKNNAHINEEILLYVLNYIYNNIKCRFINMSLGLSIPMKRTEMYDICDKLKKNGVTLVAAFDNMEVIAYPAAFDNVIGVSSNSECNKTTDIEFINNKIVNVCAKGGIQRVKWIGPKYIFTQGNSYACAHITGILSKTDCLTMEEALFYLQKTAKNKYNRINDVHLPDYPYIPMGKNAVLFPFNKEMHSLVRFKDLLCVNIVDIYDIKYSARVNSSTNKLLNLSGQIDYCIKNIEKIAWDTFDMIIIGHTDELVKLIGNFELVDNLILTAYNKGKYIYCFDDISDIVKKHSLSMNNIYFPHITNENIDPIPLGMLYRPIVPMLGIFGTTSKQGKFTLQLILRQKFLRDNYNVGQIGTEPSAYLFNMDLCFHFGYRSTTNVIRHNMVSYLNSSINDIAKKNVDIVISGCQSGTVTYDFGNVNYYTFSQTDFLLGTLPDAVILCVNSYDELDYIKRTIKYIESCVDSNVIALVIYPMGYNDQLGRSRLVRLDEEKLNEIKRLYSLQFDLPTYILGDEFDMESLYSNVISFFTSNTGE